MKKLLFIPVFLFCLSSLFAQTEVDGEVSGVWTAEGNPYIILEGSNIPRNQTLQIRPGVEIQFEAMLTVHGTIRAIGTEEDSIRFTTTNDQNVLSQLLYLSFEGEECVFQYCYFIATETFGQKCIYVLRGEADSLSLRIEHCRFYSYGPNLAMDSGAKLLAAWNEFDIIDENNYTCRAFGVDSVKIRNNVIHEAYIANEWNTYVEFLNNLMFNRDLISVVVARTVLISGNRSEIDQIDLFDPAEFSITNIPDSSGAPPDKDPGALFTLDVTVTDNILFGGFSGHGDGTFLCQNNIFSESGGIGVGEFENIRISNNTCGGGIAIMETPGGLGSAIIEHNIIQPENLEYKSVICRSDSCQAIVRNNYFYSSKLLVIEGASPLIHDNVFGRGLDVQDDSNPIIRNNIFNYHQAENGQFRGYSIRFRDNGGEFTNNTVFFYDRIDHLIELRHNAHPLISSNIFYHLFENSTQPVNSDGSGDPTIRYNIFWGFGGESLNFEIDDNNLFTDPLLANPMVSDYRLQVKSIGSPALWHSLIFMDT